MGRDRGRWLDVDNLSGPTGLTGAPAWSQYPSAFKAALLSNGPDSITVRGVRAAMVSVTPIHTDLTQHSALQSVNDWLAVS